MRVVDRAEEDRRTYNYEYLRLMKMHVEQQRHCVQENAKRLSRKIRNRVKKEKVYTSYCVRVCVCLCVHYYLMNVWCRSFPWSLLFIHRL